MQAINPDFSFDHFGLDLNSLWGAGDLGDFDGELML
jgi:hypothetical protein